MGAVVFSSMRPTSQASKEGPTIPRHHYAVAPPECNDDGGSERHCLALPIPCCAPDEILE
jgi:hypothetical protein